MEPLAVIQTWAGLAELRPLLALYLARRCRDESEADDVIQETLIRAARYRASLSDPGRLRPWVLRIALNLLRDQVRRERRLPRVEVDAALFDGLEGREAIPGEPRDDLQLSVEGEAVGKRIAMLEIGRAKRRMREPDQTVLDSYYADGGTCRETARVCEIAPDLVKVRLFRARGRLRTAVRRGLRFTRDTYDGIDGPGDAVDCDGMRTREAGAACAFSAETLESGAYGAAKG